MGLLTLLAEHPWLTAILAVVAICVTVASIIEEAEEQLEERERPFKRPPSYYHPY